MIGAQFEIVEGVNIMVCTSSGESLCEKPWLSQFVFQVNVHIEELIQEWLNLLFPLSRDHANRSSKNPTRHWMPLERYVAIHK